MALKMVPVRSDDLDGTTDDVRPVMARTFALEDTVYEIDLHDDHWSELQGVLSRFIAVAVVSTCNKPTVVKPVRAQKSVRKQPTKMDKAQRGAIMRWALSQGYTVSKFGAIPRYIQEDFQRKHARTNGDVPREELFSAAVG